MYNDKKKSPYSKWSKRKNCGQVYEDTIDHKLEKTIRQILANIVIGGETISQLNQIMWKPLSHGLGTKLCYSCPLCFEVYSSGKSEPICLPCGHTFCKPCLLNFKSSMWSGKCPYDSSEFFYLDDLLPVNYALLDRNSDPCPNICLKHNSSIVAYCSDDQEPLCGKCLLLHTTHNILEMSSEEASHHSQANLENFKKLEQQLRSLLSVWESYKERLIENQNQLDQILQNHVESLKKAEDDLVQEIKLKADKIIQRIEDFRAVLQERSTCNADQVIDCIKLHIDCADAFSEFYMKLNDNERLSMNFKVKPDFPSIKKVRFRHSINVDERKFRRIIGSIC